MSASYVLVKRLYRGLIPRSLDAAIFSGRSPASRLVLRLKSWLEARASHDQLYDGVYYLRQEDEMRDSSRGIAASVAARLPEVRSVVDVGCGSGAVLDELRKLGLSVRGLEYSAAALEICRRKALDVRKFDLEGPETLSDLRADLALSTEVAEHIAPTAADRYVDLLASVADLVVMTAATPGQGGTDHVNEQPNGYWIAKFAERGFGCDLSETEAWRADWAARGVDRHRARNVMVFRRPAG